MYILFLDFNKPLDCPPHLYKQMEKLGPDTTNTIGYI